MATTRELMKRPKGQKPYGHRGGQEGSAGSSHTPIDVHGKTMSKAKCFMGKGKGKGTKGY